MLSLTSNFFVCEVVCGSPNSPPSSYFLKSAWCVFLGSVFCLFIDIIPL